ncbi:hypothetical protein BJF78_35100 [Pseudonocardia sp. CNS-139]|nr:hypothetical protein BJF78_35100 [Pseudonocardia sp. CNS-139]
MAGLLISVLLPTASAAAEPPGAGTYRIARQLHSSATWLLTLTTVDVSADAMTVNVVYRNVGSGPAELYCPSVTGNVIVAGQDVLEERGSYCAGRREQRWSVSPGEELTIWGVFPRLRDGEVPFSLRWFNWGTTSGISLLPFDPDAGERAARYCVDAIMDELRSGVLEISVPGGDKIVRAMDYVGTGIEVEYATRTGDVQNAIYGYAEFFTLIVGELNDPRAKIFGRVGPAYLSCVKAAQYYLQEKAKETARDLRSWVFNPTANAVPPRIEGVETYTDGALVHLRVSFADPNGDAVGFGFRGVDGSGWAPESHPFASPSFGRVEPGSVSYPFNHGCGTSSPVETDVEMWVYDSGGRRSPAVTAHLACT